MTTKLYVTNLSTEATLTSVRQLFNACGEVVDVEFVAERRAALTSAAYVTMATGASALKAVDSLHGAMLHDRRLLVAVAQGSSASERKRGPKVDPSSVRITQQYRDRHGMSYELDSAGPRLTLTFVFPEPEGADWRVRAALTGEQLGDVEASGHTRELALTALGELCSQSPSSQLSTVNWVDVAAALKSVRAI